MPCIRGLYLASAIDLAPGLDGHADLLAVLRFETDARRLAVGGDVRDLRDVQRRFGALQATLRVALARLGVADVDVDTRDDDLAVLRHGLRPLPGAGPLFAGQDAPAGPPFESGG